MLHILEVTFPFFALVLLGWAVAWRRWLPLEAIPALNLFVLYLALPCMLFRFAAATPIARVFDPGVFGTWLVCALMLVGLAVALARGSGRGWSDAAFGALVAVFPNSGFMGVPLLVDLFGQRAAAPAIAALVVDMVITSSLCIALSRLGLAGAQGAGAAVAKALKGMAANPLPWAIAAGCAVSAGGMALPALLMKPISMLADAASPTALFTLGAVLGRQQLQQALSSAQPAGRGDVVLLTGFKLLLHPLLVWAVAHVAQSLGAPLDPFALTVLVLVAALPAASNVPMLAERFGADAGRIARVVLLSTAAAFVSLTVAVALMTG